MLAIPARRASEDCFPWLARFEVAQSEVVLANCVKASACQKLRANCAFSGGTQLFCRKCLMTQEVMSAKKVACQRATRMTFWHATLKSACVWGRLASS